MASTPTSRTRLQVAIVAALTVAAVPLRTASAQGSVQGTAHDAARDTRKAVTHTVDSTRAAELATKDSLQRACVRSVQDLTGGPPHLGRSRRSERTRSAPLFPHEASGSRRRRSVIVDTIPAARGAQATAAASSEMRVRNAAPYPYEALITTGAADAPGIAFSDETATLRRPESRMALAALGELMEADTTLRVEIVGREPASGGKAAHALALQRAAAVRTYLTENYVIPAARLTTAARAGGDRRSASCGVRPAGRDSGSCQRERRPMSTCLRARRRQSRRGPARQRRPRVADQRSGPASAARVVARRSTRSGDQGRTDRPPFPYHLTRSLIMRNRSC